jgi:uncharacterized protein YjbI with pentapeptide repeats
MRGGLKLYRHIWAYKVSAAFGSLKRFLVRFFGWRWVIDRPYKLLFVTAVVAICAVALERWLMAEDLKWLRQWIKGSKIFGELFFPETRTIEWKDRLQGVVLLLGLPIAFCLWHWRDKNVREQIENQRKDINLKEFQEVQMRAAGALDEKLPPEAREQLQIAALHQIRSFLRGEYGKGFKLPALELILSGHAAAVHRVGIPDIQRQVINPEATCDHLSLSEVASAVRVKLAPVDIERMAIIREEFEHIFCAGSKLQSRRFDLLDLSGMVFPSDLDMEGSHFFGVDFSWATMSNICLSRCHLEAADLHMANLTRTDFRWAHLECAFIYEGSLEHANLYMACLQGALIAESNLSGAHLRHAFFNENTSLPGTIFDRETMFGNDDSTLDWKTYTEEEKEILRAPWVALGAINASNVVSVS